jgi:hypothetical protein
MPHHPHPLHVLHGAQRPTARTGAALPTLLVAGATGLLGNAVLRVLAGSLRFGHTLVMAREPVRKGLARVDLVVVPDDDTTRWPQPHADVGVVMFEPPRMFYERERALWVPQPQQLEALARWQQACGVRTLVVVLPHAQGALPPALAHGLASLSEQVVSSLGFERVVWLRSAEKRLKPPAASLLHRARDLVLSTLAYMVPASEQPLRAAQVAQVVARVLLHAPPGVHVVPHERIRQACTGDTDATVRGWFDPSAGEPPVETPENGA